MALVCLVFAFVLFVLGAFSHWRTYPFALSLVSAGLAFWVLASLAPMIFK